MNEWEITKQYQVQGKSELDESTKVQNVINLT